MKIVPKVVTRLLFALAYFATAQALPFPFGAAVGDIPNATIRLAKRMTFLGSSIATIVRNTDGFIGLFNSASGAGGKISVYETNIDIRNGGNGQNELWVRAGNITTDLLLAKDIIAGTGASFTPQAIVVATWFKVEAFDRLAGPQNTFQVALPYSDTGETWAIFAYSQLQFFKTSDKSTALVGYNDGRGGQSRSIAVVNSITTMSQLLKGTNCNRTGIYAFQINAAGPTKPPTKAPTRVPTNAPKRAPTNNPTKTPSTSPSAIASNTPSAAPSPIDCTISWNIFNSQTDAFVTSLTNGVTIGNPVPDGNLNIEAVVPCADANTEVAIELWGGSQRVHFRKEAKIPYFLFGNNGADVLDGRLTAGVYGIRAIVNGTASPFAFFDIGIF